jgi:hypothetical protein
LADHAATTAMCGKSSAGHREFVESSLEMT